MEMIKEGMQKERKAVTRGKGEQQESEAKKDTNSGIKTGRREDRWRGGEAREREREREREGGGGNKTEERGIRYV